MVYYGAASEARQYFIDMGYVPANRQTTPDFLVAVTDPHGRRTQDQESDSNSGLSNGIKEERIRPIPQTALEFEAYYRASDIYKANLADMEAYKAGNVAKGQLAHAYKESAAAEHAQHTRSQVMIFNSGLSSFRS